jgi:hypothetical protein
VQNWQSLFTPGKIFVRNATKINEAVSKGHADELGYHCCQPASYGLVQNQRPCLTASFLPRTHLLINETIAKINSFGSIMRYQAVY